jgi:hypothetical protein
MLRPHRITSRAMALVSFLLLAFAACSGNSVGGGSGGVACDTCAQVYVNGGHPCGPGPSQDAWEALAYCACNGTCASACYRNLCQIMPVDMACSDCLATSCVEDRMTCAAN